jgi:signal transduction histidine kinase
MNMEKINVLVVDDVPQNLVAISALLSQPGLNVITVSSGPEALEVLLVEDVALALIDVQMPQMDGFELAELIRGSERTRSVPLIFLTAGAREAKTSFRGYEAGAVDFLYKPIDDTILRSKVSVFVELHAKEKQLSRQLEELKQALALNELFVAVLGHDLRNPLSAILNGAELLKKASSDPLVQSAASRIKTSGNRMTEMVEQLLDVARIRAGALVLRYKKTNYETLCRTIADELSGDTTRPRVDVQGVGNLTGEVDSDRIAQVISNLLSNALQHGTAGQPVQIQLDGSLASRIVMRVINGGVIPASALEGIFKPFYSRHSMDKPNQGLGLGLYIVKMFVESHGGTVNVHSASDKGTVFEVSLPRFPVAAQPLNADMKSAASLFETHADS